MTKVRVKGLYNAKTIEILKKHRINHFGFDLIPLSFNFLQCYQLVSFIQKYFTNKDYIYLQFKDDKDYVVKSIINEVQVAKGNLDNVILEFSILRENSFLEQFKLPFLLHVSDLSDLEQVKALPNLKGVVLNHFFLERLKALNQFNQFFEALENFYFFRKKNKIGDCVIELACQWDEDFSNSIYDFYTIHQISFEVNYQVESDYRIIDQNKLESNLMKIINT